MVFCNITCEWIGTFYEIALLITSTSFWESLLIGTTQMLLIICVDTKDSEELFVVITSIFCFLVLLCLATTFDSTVYDVDS